MCGRYWLEESPELRPFVEEMNRSPLVRKFLTTTGITTRGEVGPTQVAPVIASSRGGRRAVFPMKWGFSEKTLLINARSETASQKPLFRESWAAHRCIVPASWYFEWEHFTDRAGRSRTGRKYLFQPRGESIIWLCGLYRMEAGLPCFVILTRSATAELCAIHDRMPLMLPQTRVNEWIRPDADPAALTGQALTDMVFEAAEEAQTHMEF